MKKSIIIILSVVVVLAAVLIISIKLDANYRDVWLCENGQWINHHDNPSTPMPTSSCQPEVTEYLACGCGCCGGTESESAEECLYLSKGDDIQKYIDKDRRAAQSPNCAMMGCSSGVLYRYCDVDATEDKPTNNNIQNQFNWSTMNQGPYKDSVTYATSTDLLSWTPSNDILALHASVPGAVMKDGTIFVYFVDVSTNGIKEQLGLVKSTDQGQTWSEPTTLTIAGLGDRATADPAAVITDDGQIRLYYFDINEPRISKPTNGIEPANKIYSAISDDGVNFTQESGLRLEYQGAFDPDVLYADGVWYMYTGDLQGNQVNVATSTDGLIFTHQGTAYQGGAVPDVWHEDEDWYLYTAGINIATGVDGLTFETTGKEFRDPNSKVTADPSVVQLNDGSYLMLYKVQQ
ncbi:MAG: exo-alpha-sialidase [bacterium]|nr:exo-alpha-sialidase [bacterium]